MVARKFKILRVALARFLLDKAGLGIRSSCLLGGAKPVSMSRAGAGRKSCPGKPEAPGDQNNPRPALPTTRACLICRMTLSKLFGILEPPLLPLVIASPRGLLSETLTPTPTTRPNSYIQNQTFGCGYTEAGVERPQLPTELSKVSLLQFL